MIEGLGNIAYLNILFRQCCTNILVFAERKLQRKPYMIFFIASPPNQLIASRPHQVSKQLFKHNVMLQARRFLAHHPLPFIGILIEVAYHHIGIRFLGLLIEIFKHFWVYPIIRISVDSIFALCMVDAKLTGR